MASTLLLTRRNARDYSAPLWTLLMFDAFLRNVLPERNAFIMGSLLADVTKRGTAAR